MDIEEKNQLMLTIRDILYADYPLFMKINDLIRLYEEGPENELADLHIERSNWEKELADLEDEVIDLTEEIKDLQVQLSKLERS